MNLHVLPEARSDGIDASLWYESQRTGLGEQFLGEVRRAFQLIEESPQSFPSWEFYSGKREIRRAQLGRFPYAVVFAVQEKEILIVAITHVRRHPLHWLSWFS